MATNLPTSPHGLLPALTRSIRVFLGDQLAGRLRLLFVLLACLAGSLAGSIFVRGSKQLVWSLRPQGNMAWFLIPAMVGIGLAILRAGQFLGQMYHLRSLRYGIRHLFSTVFAWGSTRITARLGEIEFQAKDEAVVKIGGPSRLSVKAGTAVVTERGAGFGRMLGPGDWVLAPFERVCAVFDLRTQVFNSPEDTLTKDGIPTRVNVSSVFRITKHMEGDPVLEAAPPGLGTGLRSLLSARPAQPAVDPLPASREALRILTYDLAVQPDAKPSWKKTIHGQVSGSVRDTLARQWLDHLFSPWDPERHPRREISQEVRKNSSDALAKLGIDLVNCGFDIAAMPREVDEQWRDRWQVNWEREFTPSPKTTTNPPKT